MHTHENAVDIPPRLYLLYFYPPSLHYFEKKGGEIDKNEDFA
jgi:hypothetical protein